MATIKKDGKGTLALAAFDDSAELQKHEIGRPAPGPNDVQIDIKYCGMCHSDLHAVNGDLGMDAFPMAPGHEIAGIVKAVGDKVTDYKPGDKVGVGCFVSSCGDCEKCNDGQQNYCATQVQTYGTPFPKGRGHDDCAGHHTNGGYTSEITVDRNFVYSVPEGMELEYVGPLLCAGITMFNPLNKYVLKKGGNKSVAIVGFGGLGRMGAELAKAMGCEVTMLSRSQDKKDAANALGANILAHTDEDAMKEAAGSFDLIIDTVAVHHEINHIMQTLKSGGTYHLIGMLSQDPVGISPMAMIMKNFNIEGSLVGGIPETQEMLNFCNEHNVLPEIKVIHAKDASSQFKAMSKGDADTVRRVIDMSTLSELTK